MIEALVLNNEDQGVNLVGLNIPDLGNKPKRAFPGMSPLALVCLLLFPLTPLDLHLMRTGSPYLCSSRNMSRGLSWVENSQQQGGQGWRFSTFWNSRQPGDVAHFSTLILWLTVCRV